MTMVKPTPLVSICIFTYNRARYLEEALSCLVEQIDETDQSVEIVVSDNCSTDGTKAVAEAYQARRSYIVYSRNAENIGSNSNLIKSVILAHGRYAWLFCDDDLIGPGTLKKILDVIANNSDIYAIYLNYGAWSIDMGRQIADVRQKIQEDRRVSSGQDLLQLAGLSVGLASSLIVRREEFLQTDLEAYIDTWLPHVWGVYAMAISHPCYYIGVPHLMRRVGNPTTANVVWPLLYTLYFPKILNDLVQRGYSRRDIDHLQRELLRTSVVSPLLSLRHAPIEIRRQFHVPTFIRLHWRYPEFWYHTMPTLVFRVWLWKILFRLFHRLDVSFGGRLAPMLKSWRKQTE